MNILFVHQNFPGQYKHLAPALAARGHRVIALAISGEAASGVEVINYKLARGNTRGVHPLAEEFETKVLRGEAAAAAAVQLAAQGFRPDVICAHPGWGESLFLKDIWPQAKLVCLFEFYYKTHGADVNFDPEFIENNLTTAARIRVKNANNLLALEAADAGICPTAWQRSVFPEWAQPRLQVIHDGIDTEAIVPHPAAELHSERSGVTLRAGQEIVTFVSRHLEPCRGLHTFMRALPSLLRQRPNAQVLIVGAEGKGYGRAAPNNISWKQLYLNEVGSELDASRVHFLGKIPYPVFLTMLQISAVHVYLTYPFVLSWSMLEAMSAGCLVIGSRTPPVEEVIVHGHNGLLVDFFDHQKLAQTVATALAAPELFAAMRIAARATAVEHYDLQTVCLPRQIQLIEQFQTASTSV